jgi:hypothetical protein
MIFYFFPLVVLLPIYAPALGLWILLRKHNTGKEWFSRAKQPITIYFTLLGFVLLGFIFKLDYTKQIGCIIMHEPVFSFENLVYSTITISLLSIGVLIKSKKAAAIILLLELTIWLYKLYLVKEGYSVGVTGGLDPSVLLFDSTTLTLRIALLKQILNLRLRVVHIFGLSFLLILLKLCSLLLLY